MTPIAFTFDFSKLPDTANSILAEAERRFGFLSEEEMDDALILARRVEVSCDLATDGLWLDGVPFWAGDLPVDESIQRALLIWQEWYERHIYNSYEPDPTVEDVDAHAKLGFEIACAIKKSLPDWHIKFADTSYCALFRILEPDRRFKRGEDRPWIYEISTEMAGNPDLRPIYKG